MRTSEILIKKGRQVILARVLLKFDVPRAKYPTWGVWSYMLGTKNGVYVFDTGPRYNTMLNSKRRLTHNKEIIIQALDKYFKNKNIIEILISHYHHDHSQVAPELQQHQYKLNGHVPPIRLHKNDLRKKRKPRPYPQSLQRIFKKAGYKSWFIGDHLEDDYQIPGTDFKVVHTPGHTSGTISLVSDKHKVFIGGWWINSNMHPLTKRLTGIIDESKRSFKSTIEKTKPYRTYTIYTFHPKLPNLRRDKSQSDKTD